MTSKFAFSVAIVAGALISTVSSATVVSAQAVKTQVAETAAMDVPPLRHKSRRWTAADGCQYSRAGRPGETVWYLIINSSGGKDCRRVIALETYNDAAYSTVKS